MGDLAKVGTPAVLPLIAVLRQAGVDVAGALRAAKLDPDEVSNPEGRVLHEGVVRLWQVATELTGDQDLGLRVSAAIPPGAFGVVEYSLRKSPNLLEGLHRASRYFRIGHDVASLDVEIDGDLVIFEHTLPGARTLPRAAADFIMSNLVLIIKDAVTGGPMPRQVWMDYAEPEDINALRERFGINVKFDTGRRALVFSAPDAQLGMRQAEPGLCAILDQHAQDMLAKLPPIGTFSDRVRELIADQLSGGDPTAQEMARALKMSVRTLHRRLKEEGTSHKQLLAELRQQLAGKYLRESRMAVSEVAFLLGFSEPSAFHRAFRRWTGATPAAYRLSS